MVPASMLRELRIRNLAVIEDVHVPFAPGLNVLTGETGAGKSIVIDALLLLVGARGSVEVIRSAADAATVEAVFDVAGRGTLSELLAGAGHTLADEALILRRELSRSGRSRVYVNDSPATVGLLERIGATLVEIHGQHQHQRLLEPSRQLEILDRFAGCTAARQRVAESVRAWQAARGELARLREEMADRARHEERYRFECSEIDAVAPREGEDEELIADQRRLRNAERLALGLAEVAALLDEDGQGALTRLQRAAAILRDLGRFDPDALSPTEALEGATAYLEDAATRTRALRDRAVMAPERLEVVEARLHALAALKRKYGDSIPAINAHRTEIARTLERLERHEEEVAALEARLASLAQSSAEEARGLSRVRVQAAARLERVVQRELRALGMEQARFRLELRREGAAAGELACADGGWRIGPRGIESAEFLLSANPGEELRALATVVSGGELSRAMLALEVAIAEADNTPAMVFDEVDAGIGGRVADVVGQKLRQTAGGRQVLCVTHLAPIAAHADQHVVVEKRTLRGATRTTVRVVDGDARVEELARMLAGERVTAATRRHARELYVAARRGG